MPAGGEDNPFVSHAFLIALERSGSVGRAQRLAAAIPAGGNRRRRPAGLRAALRQIPLLRRVRVRPWLGRCLRARRRQLLSQAAGRRSLHPGAGPAPAGAAGRRRPRPSPTRCARRWFEVTRSNKFSSCHVTFCRAGGMASAWPARVPAPAGPAISTGTTRATARSTISWRRSARASARRSARSAQAVRDAGLIVRAAERRADREAALGRILRLLHGHRHRANGASPT